MLLAAAELPDAQPTKASERQRKTQKAANFKNFAFSHSIS
jgi:hypothetical protein